MSREFLSEVEGLVDCRTHAPPTEGSTVLLPLGAPTRKGDPLLPVLVKKLSQKSSFFKKMCNLLIFKHWQLTHTFFKTLWAKQNIFGDQIQSTGQSAFYH